MALPVSASQYLFYRGRMLNLACWKGHRNINIRTPIPFNKFPVLKRLRINIEYLGVFPQYLNSTAKPANRFEIHESLPPSLKELQLEPRLDQWTTTRRSINEQPMSPPYTELLDRFRILADNVSQHLRLLRFVGLGDIDIGDGGQYRDRQFEAQAEACLAAVHVEFYMYERFERRAFRSR